MTSWHQPSDSSFLLSMLKDGKRHSTNEIIQASLAERGVGLTVHSRAADLRSKRHLNIACRSVGKQNGRNVFEYQLVPLAQAGAVALPPQAAPEISKLEGRTAALDSTKAGGSLPCGPAALEPGHAGRHPSFAKQLSVFEASA